VVVGLTGEVPQVLTAVMGGAVVDGAVPQALGAVKGVAAGRGGGLVGKVPWVGGQM
jgi:hypothetical protein